MDKKEVKKPCVRKGLYDTPVPEIRVSGSCDKPVSDVYPVIDNDLARDNVEKHMTAADLQDM